MQIHKIAQLGVEGLLLTAMSMDEEDNQKYFRDGVRSFLREIATDVIDYDCGNCIMFTLFFARSNNMSNVYSTTFTCKLEAPHTVHTLTIYLTEELRRRVMQEQERSDSICISILAITIDTEIPQDVFSEILYVWDPTEGYFDRQNEIDQEEEEPSFQYDNTALDVYLNEVRGMMLDIKAYCTVPKDGSKARTIMRLLRDYADHEFMLFEELIKQIKHLKEEIQELRKED